MAISVIDHYWNFFLSVSKIGQYFTITTSTTVTISIILNGSQLNAESLTQLAERNKKAFKTIQNKMMRARSTLDGSQSSNIYCFFYFCVASTNSRQIMLRTRVHSDVICDLFVSFGLFSISFMTYMYVLIKFWNIYFYQYAVFLLNVLY